MKSPGALPFKIKREAIASGRHTENDLRPEYRYRTTVRKPNTFFSMTFKTKPIQIYNLSDCLHLSCLYT